MNLYLRYFDRETLVYNVEEALEFSRSTPEIVVDMDLESDIRDYVASDVFYPKRYKVRPRVYFIITETMAETMLDSKQKKALYLSNHPAGPIDKRDIVVTVMTRLTEFHEGWYEGSLDFKQVVSVPSTDKHGYKDAQFIAQCKANSGQDCCNRIVDYLKGRVDSRSQFPSTKGKNFRFKYLGMWK